MVTHLEQDILECEVKWAKVALLRTKLVVCVSCSIMFNSLRPHGLQPARLLYPWNSPGKNTGVGCHSFLQRIFPTQGSILGLLHCRLILYHLSEQERPLTTICIFNSSFWNKHPLDHVFHVNPRGLSNR